MPFVQMGRAWRESGIRQREDQERERENAEQKAQREIQMAALLAGLSERGIVPKDQMPSVRTPSMNGIPSMNMPTGRPLGDTGYVQDLTQTPQARERAREIVEQRRAEERRRNRSAVLAARGVPQEQYAAIVDDDDVYSAYAKPQEPKNPIIGSPEWMEAQRFTAGLSDSNNARQAARTAAREGQAGGNPTEGERKAGSQVRQAEAGAATLDSEGKRPGIVERTLSRVPIIGNASSRERLQVMDQAARELAIAYLRVTSGATITPQEIELTMQTVIPQAGDKPRTLAQKALARRRMVEAVRMAGGRATPQAQATGPAPSANVAAIMERYGLEP